MPGCIGWKDTEFKYVGANKHLLEMKGLKCVEEITGKTDHDILPQSQAENDIFQEQDLKVLSGEKISTVHEDVSTKIIYFMEKNPILDKNNKISGIIYYCRPWDKAEIFHLIKQIDSKFNINIQNYTLDHHQNAFQLTERECECIFLLLRGKTAKTIATLLSLSKRTVESYIENIKNKMNCQNKAELIAKALYHGYQNQIPLRLTHTRIIYSL